MPISPIHFPDGAKIEHITPLMVRENSWQPVKIGSFRLTSDGKIGYSGFYGQRYSNVPISHWACGGFLGVCVVIYGAENAVDAHLQGGVACARSFGYLGRAANGGGVIDR